MCSLFGWLDYKGIVNSKVLNKLTQSLANAAEERGTDAAGVAYVQDGRIKIYKRPKPAHKLHFKIPVGTRCVMGHTRFATQGDKQLNYNNHPFSGKADRSFALAHNGVIYNDSIIRKKFYLPYTKIETDSYIAVQLIEHFQTLSLDSLCQTAEELKGTFNLTILDDKNALYIVRGNNPLVVLDFKDIGLLVYASTKSIMDKALNRTILTSFSREEIKTVEGDILRFDKNGSLMKSAFVPKSSYNYAYDWYDFGEWGSATRGAYYGDLYTIGKMYGIDEEIIDELLDYGFSDTEIEDMFYDTETLENTLCFIRGLDEDDETRSYRNYSDYRHIDY